ncbi:MAG: nucleotidyltransferase domain-containing protein [Thermoanaerobaculia bacterium]
MERGDVTGIISVYLFGSHARGEAHPESDVDLAVLLDRNVHPRSEDRFERRLRLVSLLSAAGEAPVDLVILNDAPPSLGRAIAIGGELLFCSDPERNHSWVRDIQLIAADLDPFLDRMRRIKLEALTR